MEGILKTITLEENGMKAVIRVNDAGQAELADFSAIPGSQELRHGEKDTDEEFYNLIAVQKTGENFRGMHASRHNTDSEGPKFIYQNHKVTEEDGTRTLCLSMETAEKLHADYYLEFFKGIRAVRSWVTITNKGSEDVGIDFISSFFYNGICKNGSVPYYEKTSVFVPFNSWTNEARWKEFDAQDIGLSGMPVHGYNLPGRGNNRFHYGNTGSWSTCEYLPMGMIRDRETGEIYYYEVEHSGSWEIEIGSAPNGHLYLELLGPNDESEWWKKLAPGQSFTTVSAAFGVTIGGVSEALAELTKYRRRIRRPNADDEKCSVVFNDYMNCLMGDPTEEREKTIIDKAAALGCEYYCMDCGWYDKGNWWDRVGEWKESPERFPNGMKAVCDYAHSKGMKMGIWLEIEVMGIECELAQKLPDNWFVCRHGKRRIDNKRYLLDFRNPDVRRYCTDTVERLIKDYGIDYFKIDYNITTGPGSDLDCDSVGDALLEHYRCLYDWYRDIYRRHPDLVIENCGSGAQRMDYGLLSLQSLQSTSDQTDVISNSYIACNVASAVTPEQAGMWVYPYEDDAEHVIYNVVNGILLRPYLSGLVWKLSDRNFALMKEGVDVYKSIRSEIPSMTPFFPLGLADMKAKVLAYGLKNEKKAYLSVFAPKSDLAEIDLSLAVSEKIREVRVIYPQEKNCEFYLLDKKLIVKMPQKQCARLFEITFGD